MLVSSTGAGNKTHAFFREKVAAEKSLLPLPFLPVRWRANGIEERTLLQGVINLN